MFLDILTNQKIKVKIMITTIHVHVNHQTRIRSEIMQAEDIPCCAITEIVHDLTEITIFAQDSNWMRALAAKLNNNADRLDEMTR